MPFAKALGHLRFPANAAPNKLGAVVFHVFRAIVKLEVLQPIIRPIAVFMVDYLIFSEFASEVSGHHPSVLKNHSMRLGVWVVRFIDQDVAISRNAHLKGGY